LAIPLSVFTEHGGTSMPAVTNEPDETAAPMARLIDAIGQYADIVWLVRGFVGGGNHPGAPSKQALGVMLTCSKQGLPKIAMVFDEDVDIWDDNAQ
jgi:hypothetical protein